MGNVSGAISELKMEGLYFPFCKVERKSSEISKEELSVEVSKNLKKIGEHKYTLNLTLKAEKSDLCVEICVSADFLYEFTDEDEEKEKRIISVNTVAMVFPYVRSQLTLVTSQPNMVPIVLPPMNTVKF